MANQKYDNLGVLLAQGRLNWVSGRIAALLCKGVSFTSTDKVVTDALTPSGTTQVASSPVNGRTLSEDGAFLGYPVTFNRMAKEVDYQMLLVLDEGTGNPSLLAYFDTSSDDDPLRMQNNGTLIVRPVEVQPPPDPPILGLWLRP